MPHPSQNVIRGDSAEHSDCLPAIRRCTETVCTSRLYAPMLATSPAPGCNCTERDRQGDSVGRIRITDAAGGTESDRA